MAENMITGTIELSDWMFKVVSMGFLRQESDI